MNSEYNQIDPVTVQLKIEVPWDTVGKNLNASFGKLQKTAHVKGFRPGKAPRALVEKLFSKQVESDVLNDVIQKMVVEAVQKHELPVVSQPMLEDMPELTSGSPVSFSVKFEVRPKIEKLETKISLTKRENKIEDKDVDEAIEGMRKERATFADVVTPRKSQSGDRVMMNYTVSVDGEEQTDLAGADRPVDLGNGRLLPELEAGLTGVSPGDTTEVVVERGADDENQELAGKKVVFHINVTAIQEAALPKIDDEFAKSIGNYTTVAEMRDGLKADLLKRAELSSKNAEREEAIEKLVELNPVPVPRSLVDQQMRQSAQEYMQMMRMLGQSPRMDEETVNDLRTRSEFKVKAALVLGELARTASIEATEEDFDKKLEELSSQNGKHIAKLRADYRGERKESLMTQILEEKLVAHLISQAQFVDAPAKKD